MKKHILNTNIQLFLFPGIVLLGLIICFFTKDINLMPIFYGASLFSRSVFSFLGNVYGNGHWYSKKECILDGILFILLCILGEIEIILYMKKT